MQLAVETDKRVDGRTTREVRPIDIKIPYLPPEFVHGSALFTRGETQVRKPPKALVYSKK